MVAATKAFVELKGYKGLLYNCEEENRRRNIAIFSLQKSLDYSRQSDSLCTQQLKIKTEQAVQYENLYKEFKKGYKKQKTGKIITGATMPIVAIAAFVAGFYLNK